MNLNKKNLETFGSFIKNARVKKGIGQRELASKINVAPSYLSDIEKQRFPKKELQKDPIF